MAEVLGLDEDKVYIAEAQDNVCLFSEKLKCTMVIVDIFGASVDGFIAKVRNDDPSVASLKVRLNLHTGLGLL